MAEGEDRARAEAQDAARSGVTELFERVAERIGAHAGTNAVFAEPVERDGRTVIGVAQVMFGTGMGSGEDQDSGGGFGAGGGAMSRPVGYIEIDSSGARFVRLDDDRWKDPKAWLVASIGIAFVLRALAKLVRG